MKLIVAIFEPHKLPKVKKCLAESHITKMTVTNALGSGGHKKGYTTIFRGAELEITFLKQVRLELAVNEDFVEPAIEAIIKGAKLENDGGGDGKIFIFDIGECIKIRSGQRGPSAI